MALATPDWRLRRTVIFTPDNPSALENLPGGGSANIGGPVDFSQMTSGSGVGITDNGAAGGGTGATWQ